MKNKVCLLLLMQLWLLMNSAFAEGITVIVAPAARVDGAFITLGQLAEITGEDQAEVDRLRQLKIGNAPAPGSSVVLTKELLGMRLAGTGADFSGIAWMVPDLVTVTANSQSLSGQMLMDKAIGMIEQQTGLGANSKDLSIEVLGNVQDFVIPVGNLTIHTSLPYGIHYSGPTQVVLVINVNGQFVTKVTIQCAVKLYRQIVVAAGPINAGEILTASSLRLERMDAGKLGAGYFTEINKVINLMARRSLTPGMVVMDSMVNKPILIKRGTLINLVARIGSMEITTTGQAMQNGIEGQLIRVKNINSTKIISGKVLDENTVQVLTYKSVSP